MAWFVGLSRQMLFLIPKKLFIMKLKFLMLILSAVMITSFSAQAQHQKASTDPLKQQHATIRQNYEQQKDVIQQTYKNDKQALEARTDLTEAQKREQRRIIQDRYNEQKRANQEAYKTAKRNLQDQRRSIHEQDKLARETAKAKTPKPDYKPMKPVKPVKPPKSH